MSISPRCPTVITDWWPKGEMGNGNELQSHNTNQLVDRFMIDYYYYIVIVAVIKIDVINWKYVFMVYGWNKKITMQWSFEGNFALVFGETINNTWQWIKDKCDLELSNGLWQGWRCYILCWFLFWIYKCYVSNERVFRFVNMMNNYIFDLCVDSG